MTYEVPDRVPLVIGGVETTAVSGEWLEVIDPSTGELLCHVAAGDGEDVDKAVAAARQAHPRWASIAVATRRELMLGVATLLRREVDPIARAETLNCGKPLSDARQDVLKSADAFEFYAGAADKLFGTTIPISESYLDYTVYEPIGVTAHIAPWNYPLRLTVRSVAPALAAGNCVVLKPAEQTPVTALLLSRVLHEAGLPAGVFNVVQGRGDQAGEALSNHPGIDQLSFTGSVATGIRVMENCARNIVPVTPELGGKSPNVVFSDADLDAAVDGAIKAMFSNAGQVCCAGSRLFLQDEIHDEFCEKLVAKTRAIRVGPGIEDPDMGPLISEEQRERVLEYITRGVDEGATVLTGGGIPDSAACQRGYFVEPTILAGVHNDMCVAREEIFGPVLTVLRFATEKEAIELSNDSRYGLVAGVWTSHLGRAHRVARAVSAGQVYINDFFSGSVATPFGGTKQSGFGRERGLEALRHYTQIKNVCVKIEE